MATTDVSEWRKNGSALNVADDATKWGSGPNINSENRWFCGPDFLRHPEESWPGYDEPIGPTDEEPLACNVHHFMQEPLIDADRCSSWIKLHRTVAYVHRFVNNMKRAHRKGDLVTVVVTQNELQQAERSLWKQAQGDVFAAEIDILHKTMGEPETRHGILPKLSTIYKKWPVMDRHGIIRRRNRLGNAEWIPYGTKYPVVLPK